MAASDKGVTARVASTSKLVTDCYRTNDVGWVERQQ
jgi:hypothetical protein